MTGRARRIALAGLAALALGACDALRTRDADRVEAEARADDAGCVERGFAFPSDGYTSCRYRLAEARQSKSVREQALGASMASSGYHQDQPREPAGVYRALDVERFACRARGEGALRVVLCGEE